MPGRHGYSTQGGWAQGGNGISGVPATLSLSSRYSNTPPEYRASEQIEFLPGFESGTGDSFETFITQDARSTGSGSGGVYAGGGYRYGFNGKENDNEIKGEGNQQDYGMRIYDPRLGKFLSVDPISKSYPELTPYQFASNTPLGSVDLDGLEAATINNEQTAKSLSETFKAGWERVKNWWNSPGNKNVTIAYERAIPGMYEGAVSNHKPTNGDNVILAIAHLAYTYQPHTGNTRMPKGAFVTPQTPRANVNSNSGTTKINTSTNQATVATTNETNAAALAVSWQGKGNYPGVDKWRNVTLKEGTLLVGSTINEGQSGFFTTQRGFARSGGFQLSLWQGLQVAQHPEKGYRKNIGIFEVTKTTQAAFGTTYENPQFGQGGLPQIYIPNYQSSVKEVGTKPLKK